MHRTAACLTAIFLAGCSTSAAVLPKVSLKDDQPKPIATAAVAPVGHTVRVVAHGGVGLTKVDLELAMAKALRAKGYKVVEENQAWNVTATVDAWNIKWSVTDAAGKPHAVIQQSIPESGEVRGTDAVAAAREAAKSVAKIIPAPKGDQL